MEQKLNTFNQKLTEGFSIEVTPRSAANIESFKDVLPQNTRVYIAHIENEDIQIKFSGLNEGEKLYEELLTKQENLKKSHNKLIFIAEKQKIDPTTKTMILQLITDALNSRSTKSIVSSIMKIVPEFNSTNPNYKTLK